MSADLEIENFPAALNPLDSVEEVLGSHNWTFNRTNDDELVVKVSGKFCQYTLFFIWQENMDALQFCAQLDVTVPAENMSKAGSILMNINENIWIGHFDIPQETRVPTFRQTCLLAGTEQISYTRQFEDLVDLSLVQCERYHHVFKMLSDGHMNDNEQNLSLILMETAGES